MSLWVFNYFFFITNHQDEDLKCWFLGMLVMRGWYWITSKLTYLKWQTIPISQFLWVTNSCMVLAQVLSWDCSRCWLGLASPKWLEDSLSESALTWLLAGSLSFSPHGLLHSDLLTWQLMFPGWMIEDRDKWPNLASHNRHFCHIVLVRRESLSAACTQGN